MSGGAKAKTRPIIPESATPIDKLKITINKGGVITEVDAIHAGWAEPREYVPFSWPPDEPVEQAGWLAGVELLIEDLHWLLRRPYHRFWSQVVYDLALAECLSTTLETLPRPHELTLLPASPAVRQAVQQVALLVLKLALRMATYKESKENQLSPALFAQLVYDNYLWDMARLMDLCAVYSVSNCQLLSRQLESLFTHQPAYVQDLQLTVLELPQLLGRVEERVAGTELGKSLSWTELWDVVQYVTDLATSLDAFLRVYPAGSVPFRETGVLVRIASFYDTVIPRLWRRLEAETQAEVPPPAEVRRHLLLCRAALISVVRRALEYCCLEPLREEQTATEAAGRNRERLLDCGERYLEVMTECLAEQHFMADYHLQHPINEDVLTVRQGCPDLDPARLDYVLDAVLSAVPPAAVTPPEPAPAPAAADPDPAGAGAGAGDGGAEAGPMVDGVELESMVSHVQDLLPDLSRSFVMACLEHYNFSSERVINALLEDSLPPSLASLDRTAEAALPPPPEPAPAPAPSSVLSTRRNVFDGDEFDVMSRNDVDLSRFHKGKRMTEARLARELADKSSLREAGQRERYQLFGSLTTDGSVYEAIHYEDEYDDTYDDVSTGQEEPKEEAEEDSGPVPLNQPLPSSRWRRPDPAAEEDQETSGPRRDHFVQDPAEVRARQEARRQEQQQRRRGRGRGGHHGPPPNRDVVGAPRGQGQDKQVLQNRRRKNEQKSTQHRRGADRKQRGGMF
ncbi:activating signal cointegrator 1 complex subunit 2-like [Amphibalanus amphitrite]|uniref:activating signal cointegrator 1 complex subunit 2-like n=1 Tax=Amphibalanus amphitrite TaxID=1232801 RepID=UPI001C8FB591|nr:activating signal cointegrator 1 complex subunit 2-like [Amphibalanus amphitrite]